MKTQKLLALLLALVLALTACGNGKSGSEKKEETEEEKEIAQLHKKPIDNQFKGKTIRVVSVTPDLEYAAKAFEQAYDCKVELVVKDEFAWENVLTEAAQGDADVYTIEAAQMQKWLESDVLFPLTDVSAEVYAPYTTAFATNQSNQLMALTWSVTPVNLYYRRSIAKAVLQSDEPEAVAAAMSNMAAVAELGSKLQAAGYKIFANANDMKPFYQVADKAEKAVISPEEQVFLDGIRQMRADYRIAELDTWSSDWFKSMYGKATNPVTGKNLDVFAYVMPSWGKDYILEKAGDKQENAEAVQNPTWGDWAASALPTAQFEEGIWLGVNKNSKQTDMAKAFLVYVTQNQAFLEKWLERTKELPAYLPILESYKMDVEDSFLGGQKVMPLYLETVKAIPAKSAWQIAEEKAYYSVLEEYLQGKVATIEELQAKLAAPIEQPVEKPVAE